VLKDENEHAFGEEQLEFKFLSVGEIEPNPVKGFVDPKTGGGEEISKENSGIVVYVDIPSLDDGASFSPKNAGSALYLLVRRRNRSVSRPEYFFNSLSISLSLFGLYSL